jgi:hypothetical protein
VEEIVNVENTMLWLGPVEKSKETVHADIASEEEK